MEGVTVYGHHPESCVLFGRGGVILFDKIPVLTKEYRGYIWPRKFSKTGLLMDNTSSMYLYVKLNLDANRFLLVESKECMNSDLYEYRTMSARRGAQFVPMGMPIICWKTFPVKTTKMLWTRHSLEHPYDIFFSVLALRIRVFLYKIWTLVP